MGFILHDMFPVNDMNFLDMRQLAPIPLTWTHMGCKTKNGFFGEWEPPIYFSGLQSYFSPCFLDLNYL